MASRKLAPRVRSQPQRFSSGHAIQGRQSGFTRKQVRYEAPGEGLEHDPYAVADLTLTTRIAEKLEQHYPAHPWMVKVSHAQGVAMIKIPILMKASEHWVLHIARLACDPGLRAVVRAGGEILERYNVPRHAFRIDDFLTAREKGPLARKAPPRLLIPETFGGARPRPDRGLEQVS